MLINQMILCVMLIHSLNFPFMFILLLQTNLIKESIRMGYNDIGDFFYAHGQLSDAFKSYIRTRDYCTTSKHIVQMCMNVILVSIELGQFAHVSNYVSKAEQTPDSLDPIIVAKLRAAAGLANLETKKYKLAARKFVETGIELGNNYSEVIAPQDVAVYGALCALASFDRSDLKVHLFCITYFLVDRSTYTVLKMWLLAYIL
jgi:COP9 signalosome complex subunit 1